VLYSRFMSAFPLTTKQIETPRHRTAYLEAGPADGPLMIFCHGWPMVGRVWRNQLEHFAARGFRCIAPDMRGYGGSSVPTSIAAYAVREIVGDMIELHDALGAEPAIWVGHDWGCAIAWSIASHHAGRCRGVVNLCIPYFARGMALPSFLPLIDRELYPVEQYPVGQWDYWLFYREHFARATADFEADAEGALALFMRADRRLVPGKPAPTATTRARGGWFGDAHRAPKMDRDASMMSQGDWDAMVASFEKTGFAGGNAWYMNEAANLAYASEAPNFGRLTLPALFLHALGDGVCETVKSRLADPMREDCSDLTEAKVDSAHSMMMEKPRETNEAIAAWLAAKKLR
jgi:pimeloyl-ACP methyl ester carboxylesterase